MANTYTAIATTTVGSGGIGNVEFTSIPSTYTDLVVLISLRTNDTGDNSGATRMTFNNDTGSNYSFKRVLGDGSSASTGGGSGFSFIRVGNNCPASGNTASTFANVCLYIPNYRSSNNKSTSEDNVGENNSTTAYIQMNAGLWSGTSAITSIKFSAESANISQYSTFTLYGISKS